MESLPAVHIRHATNSSEGADSSGLSSVKKAPSFGPPSFGPRSFGGTRAVLLDRSVSPPLRRPDPLDYVGISLVGKKFKIVNPDAYYVEKKTDPPAGSAPKDPPAPTKPLAPAKPPERNEITNEQTTTTYPTPRDDLTNENKTEEGIDYSASSAPPKPTSLLPEPSEITNEETLQPSSTTPIINKSEDKVDKPPDNIVVSAQIEELEYTRASNVNVSNFVSVKLCGKSNYRMWKAQMECLMRCHKMLGIVYPKQYDLPWSKSTKLTKQYENLLNGWLIGSLNAEIIKDDRIYEQGAEGIWITLEQSYDPYAGSPTDPTSLKVRVKEVTRDIRDNTKLKRRLQNATLEGHWWKAKSILKNHKDAATLAINDNGDTLLHLAVREGKNYFIKKMLNIIDIGEQIEERNSEGHTALHIAAIVGNNGAAELLVGKKNELLRIEDNDKYIPLACAYLNKQVNAYVYLWEVTERSIRESSLPDDRKKDIKKEIGESLKKIEKRIGESLKKIEDIEIGESLLHTAIFNKQYDLAKKLVTINPRLAEDPITVVVLTRNFPSKIGFTETLMYPSLKNICHKLVKRSSLLFHSLEYLYERAGGTLWDMRRFRNNRYSCFFPELIILLLVPTAVAYPFYQLLRLLILLLHLPFSMVYFLVWKILAFVVMPVENLEKKRKEYGKAKEFLKWICDQNNSWEANSSPDSSFDNFYRTSLLEAVRLDVYEVLHQILRISSKAMDVRDKEGHNIIQLAVINRSQKVYNLISPIIERQESYRRVKDSFNNNLLHLAGKLAPSSVLSCTTGAALQLQRELQWQKGVEKLMEPTQHIALNGDYETPEMVFSREHANLVKEGEKWMKTTAESCSITAALIITIVFAAAITVPGGSNQETGIPLFKKKFAFNIFALADAVSLFSASTSLLVFLSILTTRFAEKDFLVSLPRRLFVGLCLLFLSTTAMMFAFSTILFLVFCDERPWMLAPIGGLTCFPIAAIVTLQLPLVIDLYQATYIPIFGKEEIEEIAKEEEDGEIAKQEENERKFQNIQKDNTTIRKRLSTACCLPLHRGNL